MVNTIFGWQTTDEEQAERIREIIRQWDNGARVYYQQNQRLNRAKFRTTLMKALAAAGVGGQAYSMAKQWMQSFTPMGKRSFPNSPPTNNMKPNLRGNIIEDDDAEMKDTGGEMVLKAPEAANPQKMGSQETPITIARPDKRSYDETYTKSSRVHYFGSLLYPGKDRSERFTLNLNRPASINPTGWQTIPTNITTGSTATFGWWSDYFDTVTVLPTGTAVSHVLTANRNAATGAARAPAVKGEQVTTVPGFDFYRNMYTHYCVTRVDWTMTVESLAIDPTNNSDILLFWDYQTLGGSGYNDVVPQMSLYDAISNPGLRREVIRAGTTEHMPTKVIRGSWYPNMNKRDVQNDEDVRTWTKQQENPLLSEQLVFFCHQNPLAMLGSGFPPPGIKFWLQLEYTIQYKGLNQVLKYHRQGDVPITVTFPTADRASVSLNYV